MTPYSEVYVYTVVTVVAACLTTTAGAPADTSICPNLSDGAPQYYDDQDGRCYPCPRCDPGEGLSEVCGDGLGKNARCQPCPDESFQSVSAASVCITCRRCDNTMEDEIPCTAETDRKCGECKFGYFRHDPRNDHCVRCQDEKSSQSYPDCLRTTPLPQASDWTQIAETTTTYIPTPTEGPLMSPVAIVLIVILAVCALIIIVLVYKCRQLACPCRESKLCDCKTKSRHTASENGSTPGPERQPETDPLIIIDTFTESGQGPDLTESPTEPVTEVVAEALQGAIPTTEDTDQPEYQTTEAQPPGPQPTDDDDQDDLRQDEGSGDNPRNSSTSDTLPVSDQGGTSEEFRRGSDESSASKATQTSSDNPSALPDEEPPNEDEEDKLRRFLERLNLAMEHTKQVPISEMHNDDVSLLNKKMNEYPELLPTSSKFHFVKFAKLFEVPGDDITMLRTAEQVLDYLVEHSKVELTVKEILEKLQECGECCHIVRGLVDQILKREQPNQLTRFLERLNLAKEHTKEVKISDMHNDDVSLLNKKMHEHPMLLPTSSKFHYVKFAKLFEVPGDEITMLQNAEQVLEHLVANRPVEFTVKEILEKLQECGECCHIVRGLVDQILKRQQPNAGR